VDHPRAQGLPQVPFAERDNPIHTLSSECADHPFAKCVGLRTARRRFDHGQAQTGQRLVEVGRKDRIAVVDDEAILVVGRNGFAQLLEGPGGAGMGGRGEVKQAARGMLDDHQHVEAAKGGGRCDAEITGDNGLSVIPEKS
jgi:hypothetical protein